MPYLACFHDVASWRELVLLFRISAYIRNLRRDILLISMTTENNAQIKVMNERAPISLKVANSYGVNAINDIILFLDKY